VHKFEEISLCSQKMVKISPHDKPPLPVGWKCVHSIRTHGKTAGKIDYHYFSPTWQRFRSLSGVLRHIQTKEENPEQSVKEIKNGGYCAAEYGKIESDDDTPVVEGPVVEKPVVEEPAVEPAVEPALEEPAVEPDAKEPIQQNLVSYGGVQVNIEVTSDGQEVLMIIDSSEDEQSEWL
jgi:hypothetical protein